MMVPVDEAEDAEEESSSIGRSGSSLGTSIPSPSSSSASLNSGGANFGSLGLTKDLCKSLILRVICRNQLCEIYLYRLLEIICEGNKFESQQAID